MIYEHTSTSVIKPSSYPVNVKLMIYFYNIRVYFMCIVYINISLIISSTNKCITSNILREHINLSTHVLICLTL